MKYMLLIQQGPGINEVQNLPAEELQKIYAAYGEVNATPGVTPGVRMDAPENATTVRVRDGQTVTTDGPFAELKDAVGGYLFFEADDLDAALALAAKIPAASQGGSVEVRPLVEQSW